MDQDALKLAVARAALEEVPQGAIVGIGSGSTVARFIEVLGQRPDRVAGAVSSSERSSVLLREQGIPVLDVAAVDHLPVYIDGADELDPGLHAIKGGGGALTREKILAEMADRFVCIVDASKQVSELGRFPLPVEVIALAIPLITRRFARLGAQAVLRPGGLTDNGHPILDVRGLVITDPVALEREINQWPGVITVGLFAQRHADLALVAHPSGSITRLLP